MLSARRDSLIGRNAGSRSWTRAVPSLYQVALVAILGAVFIVALAPRLDTDLWWHLKVGQYIANHGVVPSHDFMTYTFIGHSWTDHEWLAELLLFGSFSAAGLWGPIAVFACVICLTFALVYLRMTQQRVNPVLALFVVAAAFVASSASWGPRIQMLTLLFLSAYMLLLIRFSATRQRRLLLVFPVLMLLWANLHGGFVLGFVVLALTIVGEALNRWTGRQDRWEVADIRALAYALGGSVAVTLINPNGFRQLLYPLTFVLPNAFTNLIQESASPNFHMPVMMVFELLLLLLVAAFLVSRPRLNWTHLFIVLAFTHLAFSQVRNVAVWAVVVAPLVGLYLQQCGSALRELFPRLTYRRRPVRARMAWSLNLALLVLVTAAYLLEATKFITPATLQQAEMDGYPKGAIAYLERHRLPSHVFVSYSWGGYLLWHVFPQYRDFMDSRADTLFNSRILSAYVEAYAAGPDWNRVLNRYTVGTVLIERTAPLAQVLAESSRWKLVYHDRLAVLYRRV